LKNLYEAVGQGFETGKEFKKALEEKTQEEHSCMLYNAKGDDDTCYMTFMAPKKLPDIKFKF
jgi:hypothetical protein